MILPTSDGEHLLSEASMNRSWPTEPTLRYVSIVGRTVSFFVESTWFAVSTNHLVLLRTNVCQ